MFSGGIETQNWFQIVQIVWCSIFSTTYIYLKSIFIVKLIYVNWVQMVHYEKNYTKKFSFELMECQIPSDFKVILGKMLIKEDTI